MMKRTVVGVHHKTGSLLSQGIINLLIEFIPEPPAGAVPFVEIPNWMRKRPLSYALRHTPRAVFARSAWFEHKVDVSGVRLIQFLRRPLPRIASAYLYHKRGAPTDALKWADWRIFDFKGRKSYVEVLNALDPRDGLIVEALRTYPEILGSARAYMSASRLPPGENLCVWLHKFEASPADSLSAIFKFVYGDDDGRLGDFLARAQRGNIVLNADSPASHRKHATRNDAGRPAVEEILASSPEIAKLYGDVARKMGPAPAPGKAAVERIGAGPDIGDILADIRSKIGLLLLSPDEAQESVKFWNDPAASSIWQTFALSNIANGHLMMRPFIQNFLTRLA